MFRWLVPRTHKVHRSEESLRPVQELTEQDPHFDIGDLQARLSNLTIQLLYGRCDGNMAPLQPYVTPALYEKLKCKARQYAEKGRRLNIVRPCVLRCEALGYRMAGEEIRIVFRVQTRMVRYVTDGNRRIVEGSRSKEVFELKNWELSRPANIKTQADPELDDTPCPACGAPVNPYASAICLRCGTAVRVERYEWTICSIE